MTSRITIIRSILPLIGIGTLAAYSINSFDIVGPKGIILFDFTISVLLTVFVEKITRSPNPANYPT